MKQPDCRVDTDHKVCYSSKYDAYYCKICNIWLESKCSDPDCVFCKNRPNKPKGEKNV